MPAAPVLSQEEYETNGIQIETHLNTKGAE